MAPGKAAAVFLTVPHQLEAVLRTRLEGQVQR